eukprot:316293-Alexandrium_andersonii.AAC.1
MGALAAVVGEAGPDPEEVLLVRDLGGSLAATAAELVVLLRLEHCREGDRAQALGLPHVLLVGLAQEAWVGGMGPT